MNTDFIKCPCDDCTAEHKLIDEYGYFCDIICHERSYWIARKQGADAMLEALKNMDGSIKIDSGIDYSEAYLNYGGKDGWVVFIPEEE